MTDVRLSDLVDPEKEAQLRALVAGNESSPPPPADAPLEAKGAGTAVELERKSQPGATQVLEADDETGVVVALVSVTGIEDRVKDIIEPGAYTKTLGKHEPIGVWSHDDKTWVARTEEAVELMPGDPFFKGLTTMDGQPWDPRAGAVKVKARFNLETTHGREAYSDVKFFQGKTGWSIGYRATKAHRNPRTGVRHIKELDWFEYSPVMVGAASQPMTLSVKSLAQPVDADEGVDLVDVDTLTEAEVKARDALRGYLEVKASVRHVRTPEGAARYGQPIGSVIVKDRVRAADLEVGDRVDFQGVGPGGPSDPKPVKGHVEAIERDGDVIKIKVDGESHKLTAGSPIDIERAKPAGATGQEGPAKAAEIQSRLEAVPEGESVTFSTAGGTERVFNKVAGGKFRAASGGGMDVAADALAGVLARAQANGEVKIDYGKAAAPKPKADAAKPDPTRSGSLASRMRAHEAEGEAQAAAEGAKSKAAQDFPKGAEVTFALRGETFTGKVTGHAAAGGGMPERVRVNSDKHGDMYLDVDRVKLAGAAAKKPADGGGDDPLDLADNIIADIRDEQHGKHSDLTDELQTLVDSARSKDATDDDYDALADFLEGIPGAAGADGSDIDAAVASLRKGKGVSAGSDGGDDPWAPPAGKPQMPAVDGDAFDGPDGSYWRFSARADRWIEESDEGPRPSDTGKTTAEMRAEFGQRFDTSRAPNPRTSKGKAMISIDTTIAASPMSAADKKEARQAAANGDWHTIAGLLSDAGSPGAAAAVKEDGRTVDGVKPKTTMTQGARSAAANRAARTRFAGTYQVAGSKFTVGNVEPGGYSPVTRDGVRVGAVRQEENSTRFEIQITGGGTAKATGSIEDALGKLASAGPPKVPAGGLDSSGRRRAEPEAAREADQRADRARARARAMDTEADARVAERAKLAALNKRRRAQGKLPLLKLPPEAKHYDLDDLEFHVALSEDLEGKASTASLDRSPRSNWVEKAGDLPAYIREVARAIERDHGYPLDRAIPMAIGRIKTWAAGGGNVNADTRAKAAKAAAEWEALKARSHMKYDSELLAELEQKALDLEDAIDDAYAFLWDAGEFKAQVGTSPDYVQVDEVTGEVVGTATVEPAEPVVEAEVKALPEAEPLTLAEIQKAAELRRSLLG